MRLSDLQFTEEMENNCWRGHRVETPTSSRRVINNRRTRNQFADEFGDVEIEFDSEFGVYRVPAFADQSEKYSKAMQIECDKYGCE